MKKELIALGCVFLSINLAHASDSFYQPAVTAYWQIPFGASQTGKNLHLFGLRLDQNVRDNTGNLVSSFSAPAKPALVNFRLNSKGVEGLYMNGVNMASPIMLKAMESSGSGAWTIIGSAALAAVGVALSSHSNSTNNAAPPPEAAAPIVDN